MRPDGETWQRRWRRRHNHGPGRRAIIYGSDAGIVEFQVREYVASIGERDLS